MADPQTNKQIVLSWLQAFGESPDKAAEFITDEFVWHCPRSVSTLFPAVTDRDMHGVDGMRQLLAFDEQIYESGHHGETDIHFIIAEDDRVVMQQDFATKTKNGRPYRNTYCFTFRLEDGKIAEVFEHADTLYSKITLEA